MSDDLDFIIGDSLPGHLDDEQVFAIADAVRAAGYVKPDANCERIEWAVGDLYEPDIEVREVSGPNGLTITDRDWGRKLLKRTVHVGPWTDATLDGGAS